MLPDGGWHVYNGCGICSVRRWRCILGVAHQWEACLLGGLTLVLAWFMAGGGGICVWGGAPSQDSSFICTCTNLEASDEKPEHRLTTWNNNVIIGYSIQLNNWWSSDSPSSPGAPQMVTISWPRAQTSLPTGPSSHATGKQICTQACKSFMLLVFLCKYSKRHSTPCLLAMLLALLQDTSRLARGGKTVRKSYTMGCQCFDWTHG